MRMNREGISIGFRVYDKTTKEDITDKETWVITPEGNLYFTDYDCLTRDQNAEIKYIINGNLIDCINLDNDHKKMKKFMMGLY